MHKENNQKIKNIILFQKQKKERKTHIKVANIRQDYMHKESTKLVRKCSLLVFGENPCKFRNRNKKLPGISSDSGIGIPLPQKIDVRGFLGKVGCQWITTTIGINVSIY